MTRHAHIEGFTPAYVPDAAALSVYDADTDALLFQGNHADVSLFLEVCGYTDNDVEIITHHDIFGAFA